MKDIKKECLEERARSFLSSAAIGRKSFFEAFNNVDSDIKEFLLVRGYVDRGNITSLGRTYATYQNSERISA